MTLHLEQLQSVCLFFLVELPGGVFSKKGGTRFFRTVEDQSNVAVARSPRIANIAAQERFENGRETIPQPIQGGAQRFAPLLIPGMPARVAAAIAAPALHAMHTTP